MKKKAYSVIDLQPKKDSGTSKEEIKVDAGKSKLASKRSSGKRNNRTQKNQETKSNKRVLLTNNKTKIRKEKSLDRITRDSHKTQNKEIQIIPLGGLEEIGKNMTVIRYKGSAVIIDCGMAFPDDDLLGIDAVIPDFSYIGQIQDELLGLLLTHGHEDHIGGIPFLLQKFDIPIYGTALTIGLVKNKLAESGYDDYSNIHVVSAGDSISLGQFNIEFIHMNHSIPGSVALALSTDAGTIIHTGDFKIDYTPVVEKTADLARLAVYGEKGVLALLCDSTNAEKRGNSLSESVVGASFESFLQRTEGKRVIIATFASNVQRIQQIVDFAEKHNRKIAFSGRSMLNTVSIAKDLGFLHYLDNTIIDIEEVNEYSPEELVVVTTGSQGEPMSALARMAAGTHRQVSISEKDLIIISASPIPGNEKSINSVINALLKLGSDVIYEPMYDIHASGHACQDEIKLIISLVKPKYFMPVHGEYKHLLRNSNIAKQLGYEDKNIILAEIGDVVSITKRSTKIKEKIDSGSVLVDGIGVGDVGVAVIRDRQHLASDGMVLIVCSIDQNTGKKLGEPDIISRGFVYMRDSEELIHDVKDIISDVIDRYSGKDKNRRNELKSVIRSEVGNYLYSKTKRNPMILSVVTET